MAKSEEDKAAEAKAAEVKAAETAQDEAASRAIEQPVAAPGPQSINPTQPAAVPGGAIQIGNEYVTPGPRPEGKEGKRRASSGLFFKGGVLQAYDPEVYVAAPIEVDTLAQRTDRGGRTR